MNRFIVGGIADWVRRRVCRYPGRILTVKYEDVVVDLRRSAELIYRFVGVESVPNDTRAWIDQNYAAVAKAKDAGRAPRARTSRNRVPARHEPPTEDARRRRLAPAEDDAPDYRYLSPAERLRRTRLEEPDNEDYAPEDRYLSPFQKRRRTRLESAADDDIVAVRSRYASHSEKLRSRRRRAADSVNDDAAQSPAQNWRSRRLAVVDDYASRSRYPTETRRPADDIAPAGSARRTARLSPVDDELDDYTAPADSRRGRRRVSPVEDDAPTSVNMSPSRNLRARELAPAEAGAANLPKAGYTSPLEKWKKRLSPAASAAVVNEEICREYYRLSGTNPE